MTPSKKKLLKPKEVSLGASLMEETPIVELPNDENKVTEMLQKTLSKAPSLIAKRMSHTTLTIV